MVTVEIEVIVVTVEIEVIVVTVDIEVIVTVVTVTELIVIVEIVVTVEEMLIQVIDRVINHFLHKIVVVFQNLLV